MRTTQPVTVSRSELATIDAPEGTHSWRPIPHRELVQQVEEQVKERGLQIVGEHHVIAQEGLSYFGRFDLAPTREEAGLGFRMQLGMRNDNAMRFPAGLVAGSQVLVCSNLCFSGDVRFDRRHTVNILRDLPELVQHAVRKVETERELQVHRMRSYMQARIGNSTMSSILIRSMEEGVISSSQIGQVWNEWKTPRFAEFEPRTVYSAMNCFTEIFKQVNPMSVARRGTALHGLLDKVVEKASRN